MFKAKIVLFVKTIARILAVLGVMGGGFLFLFGADESIPLIVFGVIMWCVPIILSFTGKYLYTMKDVENWREKTTNKYARAGISVLEVPYSNYLSNTNEIGNGYADISGGVSMLRSIFRLNREALFIIPDAEIQNDLVKKAQDDAYLVHRIQLNEILSMDIVGNVDVSYVKTGNNQVKEQRKDNRRTRLIVVHPLSNGTTTETHYEIPLYCFDEIRPYLG